MNKVILSDIEEFAHSFADGKHLQGARILITGGTGLIGSTLVRCILAVCSDVLITLPVRSRQKAQDMYEGAGQCIRIVECDLVEFCRGLDEPFDYIIHCASPTSGKFMTQYPVETMELTMDTTRALLRYACKHSIRSLVYVSSLEYYGQNGNDDMLSEDFQGYVDPCSMRSSYPMGKRMAEYMCVMYAQQYGVPVRIARLTQTFGAGVSKDDNRVFAQFARSVIEGRDIVLHTKGESAKPYCYTTDCASAILTILLKGCDGEAYNVANPDTYISIREMADFLRINFNNAISVIVEEHPEMGYAPVTKLHLSVQKLMALGWKPQYGLREMFERLIASMS